MGPENRGPSVLYNFNEERGFLALMGFQEEGKVPCYLKSEEGTVGAWLHLKDILDLDSVASRGGGEDCSCKQEDRRATEGSISTICPGGRDQPRDFRGHSLASGITGARSVP